jgi:parallel beta-helix repeat protein
VYNNDISFNSGLGIGLYRSSYNRIMHNKLDWNARGYSHGKYARGQDSSAILLYEQSSHNTIAYNSGTHSGDGLFLWAGQSTMDTGLGGCDSNMICRNDFSHSIANGIEVTFSANYMIENILNDCRYGVWGGYSHHSVIRGNEIRQCETGIAIEHGRYNVIEDNTIAEGKTGIQLWDRASQPDDWPYAKEINVKGRGYHIVHNHFEYVNTAFEISLTDSVWLDDNTFLYVPQETASPKGPSRIVLDSPATPWSNPAMDIPDSMSIGNHTALAPEALQGRKYIIINEWGPYDFQYPLLALRSKKKINDMESFYFDLYGPHGEWHIDSIAGCLMPDHHSGTLPDSVVIQCPSDYMQRYIGCSFTGDTVITQFGDTIQAGLPYQFHFEENSFATSWKVSFFAYDSLSDPIKNPVAFDSILRGKPITTIFNPQLVFQWWGSPAAIIPEDHFAVRATTTFIAHAGEYTLEAESDDGIRVWLDGRLILDHWDIHTPMVDEIKFTVSKGSHELKVEYFEGGGLGVLDVMVR